MKFIKKHGRIIPIRESSLTEIDAVTGFASGVAQGLFIKSPKVVAGIGFSSLASGAYTTRKRLQPGGSGLFSDIGAMAIKSLSKMAGLGVGLASLKYLNRLIKSNAAKKAAQSAWVKGSIKIL